MADVVNEWREDAATFRKYGQDGTAAMLEACVAQLEASEREAELEAISLEQAADESGYSYSAIQKMVARGELANVGRKHAPRVRRADIPSKGKRQVGILSVDDFLACRLG